MRKLVRLELASSSLSLAGPVPIYTLSSLKATIQIFTAYNFEEDFFGGLKIMGISSFPCSAEGVVPVLVMNTVLSVALLKNMVRSALQVIGAASTSGEFEEELYGTGFAEERRVSTTQFKYSCGSINGGSVECCVCLCRFGEEDEVSELSCDHFFHKSCLDKWFHHKQTTCPLCRSIH